MVPLKKEKVRVLVFCFIVPLCVLGDDPINVIQSNLIEETELLILNNFRTTLIFLKYGHKIE